MSGIHTSDPAGPPLELELLPGRYFVMAADGEYISKRYPVNLELGTLETVVLSLQLGIQAEGWVQDAVTAAPIPGVKVWMPEIYESMAVFTDDSGHYVSPPILADNRGHSLWFSSSGYSTKSMLLVVDTDYSWSRPEFGPDEDGHTRLLRPTEYGANGAPLRGKGGMIPLDVQLVPSPPILVRVLDVDGGPISGAEVRALGHFPGPPGIYYPDDHTVVSGGDGVAVLSNARADVTYRIGVHSNGLAPSELLACRDQRDPRGSTLEVVLSPGYNVSGEVIGTGTYMDLALSVRPASEREDEASSEDTPADPGCAPTGPPLISFDPTIAADGTFLLHHVPPGFFEFRVRRGAQTIGVESILLPPSDSRGLAIHVDE